MCTCLLFHFHSQGQSLCVQKSHRAGGKERGQGTFGVSHLHMQTCPIWTLAESEKLNCKCDLASEFSVIPIH